MKLGSLFDGSGGFPLAGVIHGIEPVWASEIEPYPLKVTAVRFPRMKQLGDITRINGALADPVDVVTFGSPCQDLSVAGAQAGIHDGERSSLFFEAIRIIKEMRGATNGKHPRFAVWENVPGAFSSNKGKDFQAVLQALCEVCGETVPVPEPPKGKWTKAGCIVGDGYSIAWRVYDAQYWGVPQRRKRIYLVADFGSERAGEILFERESLRWDSAESGEAREGTAHNTAGSARGSCYAFHLQQDPIGGSVSPCIGGQHQATVGVFMGGQSARAGSIAYDETVSPTLRAAKSGSNQVPDVVYPEIARTLAERHDSSPCVDRGQNVVALDCRNIVGNEGISGTLQAKNEGGFSLNFINPVVYSSGSFGTLSEGVGCIGTGTRATNEMIAVYDTTQITSPHNRSNPKSGDPCHTIGAQQHPPLAVYPEVTGALCANSHPGSYTGQDAFNDMLPVYRKERRYVVRRLMPLECCRLQGFPDWWEDGANGSDSARYKMWGNGIALPCAADVLGRIAKEDA